MVTQLAELRSALSDGLFTTADARQLGIGDRALRRMVREQGCWHLARGLYDLAPPRETRSDQHLRLAQGGLLLYPDAALSHVTALLAHGVQVWGADLRRARLARPVECEVLTARFAIWPRRSSVVEASIGPAVAVSDALVQNALESGAVSGIVSADHALHVGLTSTQELEASAAGVAGWPRSGRVSTMMTLLDARSESPGESRLRVHCHMAQIPVTPQVVIRDQRGTVVARVDLAVDGTRVLIEFDGLVKYREGGVEALVAEKRREDSLRALGYIVVRVTWADLAAPAALIRRIRAVIASA